MMEGVNGMTKDDFLESDYPETYTISFEMRKGTDRKYSFEGTYDEDVPWTVFMQRFVEFLEGTGYMGVQKRVSIEDSPFLEGCWFGPIHDVSDQDDWK